MGFLVSESLWSFVPMFLSFLYFQYLLYLKKTGRFKTKSEVGWVVMVCLWCGAFPMFAVQFNVANYSVIQLLAISHLEVARYVEF
jgi:hypothetical protein